MSGPPRRVVPRKRASDGANIEVPITQIRKDDNYTPLERQVLQLKAENPGRGSRLQDEVFRARCSHCK